MSHVGIKQMKTPAFAEPACLFESARCASALLLEVRAERVDRRELHHALRQLSLDRAVGIKRVGHAVDDAGLEDRRPPLGRWLAQNFGHPLSLAGRVSRGRAGIGGSGISSAGSRLVSTLGSPVDARRGAPRSGHTRSNLSFSLRRLDLRRGARHRLFGPRRRAAAPAAASRLGDQTFGSSAGSAAAAASTAAAASAATAALRRSVRPSAARHGRRHRRRWQGRRHRLGFRAQPIERTGRRLAGGGRETRLGA